MGRKLLFVWLIVTSYNTECLSASRYMKKRQTRKASRKRKPSHKTRQQPPLFILFCILVFLIGVLFVVDYIRTSGRPVVESPRTELKEVPSEVKKRLHHVPKAATLRVPILMYHYVEYVQDTKDKMRQSLNINPAIFEQQLLTLKNAGYTFLTAKDLGDVLNGRVALPQKPILLTFDDGHWDLYTSVLPLLKKYHIKATAYIISSFIGGSDFLTKEQLQVVIDSKLVDIGAHTVHHVALKNVPLLQAEYEIAASKEWLEKTYHIHVVSFAYPNGSFDTQAMDLVKKDGYTTAVSTIPGIEQNQDNRYFLYRLRPGMRTGQELLNWLQQSQFQAYR